MTDHEHAATGPGPGTGPRPAPGTGPSDAAPAAAEATAGAEATGAAAGAVDEAPPRFRRDRRHKMIAGVCAGLGRHTDLDPVIFRITLSVLAATGGIGLLFYGFAWLFVPYEDREENEVRKLLTGRVDGQALAAVLFALVGCGVLLTMIRNGQVLAFAVVLSLLLAGAGYWSRHRGAPDPDPLAAQAVADAPPEAQAPPIPVSFPSWWRDPIVKDGTHVGGTGYLWGPSGTRGPDAPGLDFRLSTPWVHGQDMRARRSAPPKPRGPRWIGGWIFLLALLAGGLGTGLTWDTHPLGTSLQTGLACALVVFGLGVAVSSFLGRTGAGSLFLALVTAALLAGASAMPSDITTHWTRTSWTPATAAEVSPAYDLGTGVATLDLTHIRVAAGQTVSTAAEVGAGRLEIVVPADVTVRMSIDVGVGDIQLPGDDRKDVDVEPGRHKDVTLSPTSGTKNAGTLDLDLQVGAGQVEVTRAAA
ncbi:phage shock protein C (PspC) family protein [Streptomyces sp. Ag109_O5-1]|uniref:PspC domain-containing protein n=1 Tax=Streptomyces sp. Ag109_O5-1 TaxID=1938851 RepID=UPI000F4EF7C3|nr:PspC domain-containing protein [Streptomyces sp. Ag109_O5-1]RPE41386.1 phage shock protein C (PspC) family protein [Streptomyces sp. Ag109_O5-1]